MLTFLLSFVKVTPPVERELSNFRLSFLLRVDDSRMMLFPLQGLDLQQCNRIESIDGVRFQ